MWWTCIHLCIYQLSSIPIIFYFSPSNRSSYCCLIPFQGPIPCWTVILALFLWVALESDLGFSCQIWSFKVVNYGAASGNRELPEAPMNLSEEGKGCKKDNGRVLLFSQLGIQVSLEFISFLAFQLDRLESSFFTGTSLSYIGVNCYRFTFWTFFFLFLNSFIRGIIQRPHNLFKVLNWGAFSIFTYICMHHNFRFCSWLCTPKPWSPWALENHQSTFCLYRFASFGLFFINRIIQHVVLCDRFLSHGIILSLEGLKQTGAEAPIPWPPEAKSWLTGKDPDAGKDWGRDGWMASWTQWTWVWTNSGR